MHASSRLLAASLAVLSLSFVACSNDSPAATDGTPPTADDAMSDEPLAPIVADRNDRDSTANAVLEAFARGDWETLSSVSADTGVRFTPYTHVNALDDRTVTKDELAAFAADQTKYVWGTQEGSGEPIDITNAEYLARYVWDHDYRDADDIRWNAEQQRGSMVDNVQEIYPGATTVEYHFAGFDDQYGGMDWRSLRLVLAQNDDAQWTLYGVIHDEWTP